MYLPKRALLFFICTRHTQKCREYFYNFYTLCNSHKYKNPVRMAFVYNWEQTKNMIKISYHQVENALDRHTSTHSMMSHDSRLQMWAKHDSKNFENQKKMQVYINNNVTYYMIHNAEMWTCVVRIKEGKNVFLLNKLVPCLFHVCVCAYVCLKLTKKFYCPGAFCMRFVQMGGCRVHLWYRKNAFKYTFLVRMLKQNKNDSRDICTQTHTRTHEGVHS